MLTHATRLRVSRAVLVLVALTAAGMAAVEPPTSNSAGGGSSPVGLHAERTTVELLAGRSQHFPSPWPVKGASLTDPDVADVQVLTPDLVLVSGRAPGTTDVLLWSDEGDTREIEVTVVLDLASLERELGRLLPGTRLDVSQENKVLIIGGALPDAESVAALDRWLEAKDLESVNATRVAGVQQVQVQVKMAEVSRTGIRSLGVNGVRTGDDFFLGSTVGPSSGGAINPIVVGPAEGAPADLSTTNYTFNQAVGVSPAVTLFAGFPGADLELFFQALEENQFLRVLAEPSLVALSGEDASFLAGGEFPIPVVQGGLGGGGASITIQYKQFGVGLKFRPTVLGEGSIRLFVSSEVSDLSDLGAVQIQGFQIPSVTTRRAETTLEMKSGQTFAMAGLLSEDTTAQASEIPGLGRLPILGKLFRSVRYRTGETELLVLVTASLVQPLSDTELAPLPGTTHVIPSDWELYSRGKIEGRPPARLALEEQDWLGDMGFGRLRGPGAWATHEAGAARGNPKNRDLKAELEARAAAEAAAAAPAGDDVSSNGTGAE